MGVSSEGGLELVVVCEPAGGVHEAAGDGRDKKLVRDIEVHNVVEVLRAHGEFRVELCSRRDSARDPVQDEPVQQQ